MDLFSHDYDPTQPIYPQSPGFVRGSDTSEAAAKSLNPKTLSDLEARICRYVAAHFHDCSARTTELVLKGRLVDSGERRRTSSGRAARVLKIAQR